MRNVLKSIFTVIITSSAFLLGLYLGREKIMSKIPHFQNEPEDFS